MLGIILGMHMPERDDRLVVGSLGTAANPLSKGCRAVLACTDHDDLIMMTITMGQHSRSGMCSWHCLEKNKECSAP